ncbi:GUN4 domain-containing protein [Planktothrix sp. FACHB-1365]|uniref:GUN4 domain-containing protein n=1 Tax=Planktothrix sp. FACHB-1365 TaxID=2692855 RepID=UPI0016853992|nr:GUN4 domain-containing protein [Planktothrix sp. FACHB-1365]MBD2484536.1 GUN4 domain-containing protein [Planktothrix sp. FACHB-1365]
MYKFNQFIAVIAVVSSLMMGMTSPVLAQTQSPSATDLTPLQQQLKSGNWKASDIETRRLIQQWIFPKGDVYAKPEVNQIPCESLKAIDTLWKQASNNQFGFSIQQQQWQKLSPKDRSSIEFFGKKMGWVRPKPLTETELQEKWFASTWVMESEVNFTPNAPVGHLPWPGISQERVMSLINEIGLGCGSCSIDAMYLQEERNYTYLPAFYNRVNTCLASNPTSLSPLETALASGNWKEANRLTSLGILDLAGKREQTYLIATDTRKLSCQSLKKIDQLWVKYSQGRFGLSVQAQIWQNLKGKSYEDSLKFEKAVGWTGTQPIFDLKSAPKGHLPLRPVLSDGMMNAWGGGWIQELSNRLKSCL